MGSYMTITNCVRVLEVKYEQASGYYGSVDKCRVRHMGTSIRSHSYRMHQYGEDVTELENDLGICMNPRLTFYQIVNKRQLLGIISHSYAYLDNDMVKTLYSSLIRPHTEYGNTAWTPRSKKVMALIRNVQRLARKLPLVIKYIPYEERFILMSTTQLVLSKD